MKRAHRQSQQTDGTERATEKIYNYTQRPFSKGKLFRQLCKQMELRREYNNPITQGITGTSPRERCTRIALEEFDNDPTIYTPEKK